MHAQIHVKSNGVGIGTNAPAEKLHVAGKTLIEANDNVLTFSSSNTTDWQFLSFSKAGNRRAWVGLNNGYDFFIRPEQPGANIYLQPISGKVIVESSHDNGKIGGSISLVHPGKTAGGQVARDWSIYNMTGTYGNSLQFWAYSVNGCNDMCNPAVIFSDNGNVGIGIFPQYKLHVNGTVKATTYLADVNPHWPDYVFDSTYNLPALFDIEKYIHQNHHLPEVPSAEKVKKEGINLGDNQAVLLRKIEELTLYAIEQQKMIQELQAKMKVLEEKSK
jgi:hypothetical protein